MTRKAAALALLLVWPVAARAANDPEPDVEWVFQARNRFSHENTRTFCDLKRVGESPVRRHMVLSPDESTLYVASVDTMYGVNTDTGKLRWMFECMDCRAEPSLSLSRDGAVLYVGSVGSDLKPVLLALHADTGEEKWKFTLHKSFAMCFFPTVTPDGSHVIASILGREAGLLAMDAPTGRVLWNYTDLYGRAMHYAAVHPDGHTAYVRAFYQKKGSRKHKRDELHAVDVATGERKWFWRDADGPFTDTYAPVLSPNGREVYVWTRRETLYALDSATGAVLWEHKPGYRIWSVDFSPDGSSVFFGDSRGGILHNLDLSTLTQRWAFRTVRSTGSWLKSILGLSAAGSLATDAKGRAIFTGTSNGDVFALSPNGTRLWSKTISGRDVKSIVVGHNRGGETVFVRADADVFALTGHATHFHEHTEL